VELGKKFICLDNPAGADGRFNLGDDIQVLAAIQNMSRVDGFIEKGKLYRYDGDRAAVIMNGWFMHDPKCWPPSEKLDTLMVSFHMNPGPSSIMLERGREFFERSGPIGCRDFETLEIFKRAGIDSYYSGCLTLTLEREKYLTDPTAKRNGVYAVDLLYKMRGFSGGISKLQRIFGLRSGNEKMRGSIESRIIDTLVDGERWTEVNQVYHSRQINTGSREERYCAAREALSLYANARLVLTSRIHCALPCLAFGTPVIFVDGSLGKASERARLRGIIELMPVLRVNESGECDFDGLESSLSPEATECRAIKIAELRRQLVERCSEFCAA
jgi:hypothetical protein